MFTSTFFVVWTVLLAYVLLLIIVNMLLQRAEKLYQKNQLAMQQQYTETLEAKNRQLEEALDQAEKANMAKSSFLSRMSHDIRTPLNGIVGLLKIDEDHFEDRELVRENHKKMQTSANHLLSLINDVLQMSKLEDGSTVHLRQIFLNIYGKCAGHRGRYVILAVEPQKLQVMERHAYLYV